MEDKLIHPYSIVSATNKDITTVKRIVFQVLHEYGLKHDETGKDHDLTDIQGNYLDHAGFFGLVMEAENNSAVGTFGIFPVSDEEVELRKMYLLKEARGQGCGRMMMGFVIDWAMQRRYKKITLETKSVLHEAIALYKKYGFAEIKPLEVNDRVDQAFELKLEKP